MPRKSKALLRRSAAAKKGWRTRRAREQKRSAAAKKGAATRARRKAAQPKHKIVPAPDLPVIIRVQYKNQKGKTMHFEIHSIGGKIVKVRTGPYEYTSKKDLDAIAGVLAAASEQTNQR